jgi:hypothetical protein
MMKKLFEQRKTRPAPSKEKTTHKKKQHPFPAQVPILPLPHNQSIDLPLGGGAFEYPPNRTCVSLQTHSHHTSFKTATAAAREHAHAAERKRQIRCSAQRMIMNLLLSSSSVHRPVSRKRQTPCSSKAFRRGASEASKQSSE